MKVLNILLSNHVGGPTLKVLETSKRLMDAGIDVVIISPEGTGNFGEITRKNGIKLYQVHISVPKFFNSFKSLLDNIKWLVFLPFSTLEIYKVIKKEDVDIVHVHGLFSIPGGIAAKLSSRKLVWHLLGSVYPKWLIKLLMPFVEKISDHMIFIAHGLCEYYLGSKMNKLSHKYSIIYEGVDTKKFHQANVDAINVEKLKKEFGITNNPIIGCIGNINPAKGYEYLVRAAYLLNKENIEAKFILVGADLDTQKKYYLMIKKLLLDLGMEGKIILSGERNDILDFLYVFDIFVLPSVAEGTPMVILEAMSMQKPIIATNVGAISEQIINKYNGILIESKNPKLLCKSIKYLILNHEKRNSLGKNARKIVENKFSIEKNVEKNIKVYRMLLNSHN